MSIALASTEVSMSIEQLLAVANDNNILHATDETPEETSEQVEPPQVDEEDIQTEMADLALAEHEHLPAIPEVPTPTRPVFELHDDSQVQHQDQE